MNNPLTEEAAVRDAEFVGSNREAMPAAIAGLLKKAIAGRAIEDYLNVDQAARYLCMLGLGYSATAALALALASAPASAKHHLAVEGGLLLHSCNVTARLLHLSKALMVEWERPESPYIVGMLHDLCKTQQYQLDGRDWRYVPSFLPGHGAASVMLAVGLLRLTRQESVAIAYHMGHFGVGREYTDAEFNEAVRLFARPILATHMADWWAAKVDEDFAL